MTLATTLTGLLLTISGLFFLVVTLYLAIKLITGWIEKLARRKDGTG